MNARFGEILKDRRIAKGMTLRQCSSELGVDPSNWSKIERGINPAPKDDRMLLAWAEVLGLQGEEVQDFLDQAAISRSEIPTDLGSDSRIVEALPVFFRAAREADIDDAKIERFLEQVRKLNTPD